MKCSVLGHKYGPEQARTETNANDNGDVETLQRVKECTRCGAEKVVGENKQIRPTGESSDAMVADGGDETSGLDDEAAGADDLAHGYDVDTDDALIIGDDDPADEMVDAATDTGTDAPDDATSESYQTRDIETNDEGVAFIGGSDTEETAEPADDEGDEAATSGRGAEILGTADDGDSTDDEPATAKGLEDPPDEFPGSSDAVFIENSPESETQQDTDPEPTDAVFIGDDPTSDGAADADEDGDGDESAPVEETGDGHAVIIPGSDDGTDAAETSDSGTSAGRPQPSRQGTPRSERPVPEDARYLTCTGCSYREAQTRECRWAGDACPQCRSAFLKWEDE